MGIIWENSFCVTVPEDLHFVADCTPELTFGLFISVTARWVRIVSECYYLPLVAYIIYGTEAR